MMPPELRRAIIKIIPEYFFWDEARQELYRVNIPKEDLFKIKQYLLKEVFDITVSDQEELDDAHDDMNDKRLLQNNSMLLYLQGIGEDLFYLNEHFGDGKNLLSFPTLYDYDLDDYKYQEKSRKETVENYEERPYRGSLYFTWARLMIDDEFNYCSLCMVSGYILSRIEESGMDYIEKLIPHEFKHGKNHGKEEGAGYLLDIKTDAKGLELHLDELKHRLWKHLKAVHEKFIDEFDKKQMKRVFIVNQSGKDDPNYLFLFTDKEVLKNIYFKSFMSCCRKFEQKDHSDLLKKLEKEKQDVIEYLDFHYKDIMDNFDPKIVRFGKKYKIMIHKDSGLDALLE